MFKKYSFPEKYQEKIEKALNNIGFSLTQPKPLAEAILALSDFYQKKEKVTPWSTKQTQAAYLAYFFPLNYIRNLKVFDEIKKVGFAPPHKNFLDYGFGLGSGYLAAKDSGVLSPTAQIYAVDSAREPLNIFKTYFQEHNDFIYRDSVKSSENFDLAIFSYSLNETPLPTKQLYQIPNLIIVEPSTQAIGRQLMARRAEMIETGYKMWAPCTHQNACPLLIHSKTDWCHDRVHWEKPPWWQKLEALLPIKNQTMTYSYLVASHTAPPIVPPQRGRVVGDDLPEKGKTRWMFCRDDEREFLSWLKKSGEAPELHRGELLDVEVLEKKGNELRFKLS